MINDIIMMDIIYIITGGPSSDPGKSYVATKGLKALNKNLKNLGISSKILLQEAAQEVSFKGAKLTNCTDIVFCGTKPKPSVIIKHVDGPKVRAFRVMSSGDKGQRHCYASTLLLCLFVDSRFHKN